MDHNRYNKVCKSVMTLNIELAYPPQCDTMYYVVCWHHRFGKTTCLSLQGKKGSRYSNVKIGTSDSFVHCLLIYKPHCWSSYPVGYSSTAKMKMEALGSHSPKYTGSRARRPKSSAKRLSELHISYLNRLTRVRERWRGIGTKGKVPITVIPSSFTAIWIHSVVSGYLLSQTRWWTCVYQPLYPSEDLQEMQ
jgi:hypothetical protein